MPFDVIQTSFSAGEIAPALYGRTDIAQYSNAVALAENMIPKPTGSIISSPGSNYVATASSSTLKSRLIPFIFNKTDSYVIEMGDLYMRFYTNRGQVVDSAGAATEDISAVSNRVSHWKCNDNTNSTVVLDAEGSHNGTSTVNTATISTTGVINQAFDFDGTERFTVADHADFTRTSSTQPMSIAAWVYYSNSGGSQVIFGKITEGGAREYQLFISSTDKLNFYVYDDSAGGSGRYSVSASISDGWNFVVVGFCGDGTSSSDATFYVNGAIAAHTYSTDGTFVAMEDTTSVVSVGARANGQAGFKDRIDNVAFFHKKLTQTDINALYATGTVYQITTVFTEDELADVHFTQLNDVVWLAHPNHPTQKLIRTSAAEWTIEDAPTVGGPFLDNNTPATTSTGVTASTITLTASATSGTVNITVSPTNASLFTVSGSTLGHHNSYWMIGGLAQTNATTGLEEVGYVQIDHVINGYTATATVIKNLKAATATTEWAEGAWSAVRGYPARTELHERRLWFARTNYEPQKAWASKIFEYENFALDTQADDDALNLPLATGQSNEIQWLKGAKSIVAGTFGGALPINSGSSEAITPNNVRANDEVGFGSKSIQPKILGSFVYYIQRFGMKLREMFYFFDNDTYKAVDTTVLSPHILDEGVIDMDVQQNPEPIIYCVLTNGTLATFTREVDQEMQGWARQTTDGTYTSIAIIPSQEEDYDEVWALVERWVNGAQKKYVEYFNNLDKPSRQDKCNYLHSSLSYDAYSISSATSATISLSASTGSVTLTSSTAYFTGEQVNNRLRAIDENGTTIGEGVITATASTTSLTLSITTTFNTLSYASGRWGISVSSISGLDHLEAKTVGILADGQRESLTKTVASGAVTLDSDYFVINAGLSYDQILQTLPKEVPTNKGTIQGQLQRYVELMLKVVGSTQNFKYGPDADNLDDINTAFTPTVTTLYTGVIPPAEGGVAMRGGYKRGAQIYIKNSEPLPIEITSIMAKLETNSK